ncbi:MAG: hypothetical protein JNJ85_15820, partial [Candidatus Kapabacteria bacterium]|nr:hypothetical protein [Candidatus Kapabacteria bacterium]
FANTNTGYLTFYSNDTTYKYTVWVYKTTNGGVSWKNILKETYLPNPIDGKSADNRLKIAKVFGPDTVVVVTDRGLVRATFNGGKTWEYIVSEKPKDMSIDNRYGIVNEGLHFVFETPWKAFAGVRTAWTWGRYNYGFMQLTNTTTDVEEDTTHNTLNVVYASVWLESVSPQPANDGISVKAYYVSETGELPQARLYNVMGDMVADYSSDIQQQHPNGWFTTRLSTKDVSSGVYFLQLGNSSERRTIPVSVVR